MTRCSANFYERFIEISIEKLITEHQVKCVFGLEFVNLNLDKFDFVKLILVKSEFKMK